MSRKTEHLSLRAYLIEVTVEQVNIQIRFPCTISISVKIGREESFSNQEVKPIDNRVSLSHKLQLRTNMVYDTLTHQFTQKKAAIHVHVNSLTGRNTAGVSKLDIAEIIAKPPIDVVKSPLERCPDRNAEIFYRLSVRFEGQLPYQQQSLDNISYGEGKPQSDKDSRGEPSRLKEIEYAKDQQPSFGGSLIKNDYKESRNTLQKDMFSSSSAGRHRILDELDAQGPNDSLKRNRHRPPLSSFRPNPQPQRLSDQPTTEFNMMSIPPLGSSTASRVRNISYLNNSNEGSLEAQRKIVRLETERQNQVKMIASLNSQLELNKAQLLNKSAKQSELIFQIQKFKRKIDAQQIQLQNAKKTKGELQKQLSTKLADQKSNVQLQHKLSKVSELQIQVATLRKSKQQADRSAKQRQKQYNILLDKVQDMTNTANTNQKRLEMKDTFYKEQVRKYSEKLVEIQLQKQKLMSEIQSLKSSLDDKNRKIEILTRDRDRHLQDQKAKFTKKIEQMKLESQGLQTKRSQDHQELASLGELMDKIRVENTQLGLEKIRLEQQIERLRNKLMAESIYKNKYEEQLKEKGSIHKQKTVLERQLEADRRHLTLTAEKLQIQLTEKLEQSRQMAQRQIDLQKQLKQREVKIADQDFEIESLRKKCQTAKKNEQKKIQELIELQSSLETIIQSENNKKYQTNSMVHKYEKDIVSLKETIAQLNQQIATLKTNHQTEINTIQAQSQNHTVDFQQTFSKLISEKETMEMQLSHERMQLLQSSEKHDRLLIENNDLNNLIFSLQNQIKDHQLTNTKLDQELYKYNQALKKANSQIQRFSQQHSDMLIQAEQASRNINQLLADKENKERLLEQLRREHSQQVDEVKSQIVKVQTRNRQLMTQIQQISINLKSAKDTLNASTIDNTALSHQYQSLRKEYDQVIQENELIKNDLQETIVESQNNTSEVGQLKKMLRQSQIDFETLKIQSEKLKILLENFGIMLSDFIISQQVKSINEIQSVLSQYQKLPFTITNILSKLNQDKLKHQQKQRVWQSQQIQLNSQITSLKAEVLKKENKKKILEQDLIKENESILETIEIMRQEQANMETNLQDANIKLESTIQQAQAIENERLLIEGKLRIALKEIHTTRANLEHQMAQTILKQNEINTLTAQLDSKTDEFNGLRQKGYSEQSEMFKELEITKIQLLQKEQEKRRLMEQQQLRQQHLMEVQHKLNEQVTDKSILINHLESLLNERNSCISELQEKLEHTAKKDKQIFGRLNDDSRKTLQQEAIIQRLLLKQLSLTNALKDLEVKIQIVQKEKENQLKRINGLIDEVSGCDYMLNTLKSDLQTTQQQLDDTNELMRKRDAEKSSLEDDLTNKSKTIVVLNQQISKLKDLIYRINRSAEDKESEITESAQQSISRMNSLEKELHIVTNQRNTLKEKLKQEQNLQASNKRAFEKTIEELTINRDKLQAEVMELNEQIYSISSDVNTMRLRQEQDQENMERLQNQLSMLASMYVAEKKKCEILQHNNSMYQNDKTGSLQSQIRQLRAATISNIEQIRRLSAQNTYMHQQITDNSTHRALEQRIEQIKREYSEELAIMQQIINRERKEYETMRRQYHQKCIIYQNKIRSLQVQFRNEKQKEKDEQDGDRLDTIEEEKSSSMSEMGNPIVMNSSDRLTQYTHENDVNILRQQLKMKDDELVICSLKISQLQNIIDRQQLNGQGNQLQEQVKSIVSQKLYFMSKIREILIIVMRIKSKIGEQSDLNQESTDIMADFKLLQAKLIEVSEHSIRQQQPQTLNFNDNQHTLSQSTGIVESNSQNQRQFDKIKNDERTKILESDHVDSIATLANRLKVNLSNYKN